MHESEVVALKVLRLSQDDPDVQTAQQVSVLRGSLVGGSFAIVLMDGVAVLRGSLGDEADRTRQDSPFLRSVNDHLRLLSGVSMVRKQQYRRLFGEEHGCK